MSGEIEIEGSGGGGAEKGCRVQAQGHWQALGVQFPLPKNYGSNKYPSKKVNSLGKLGSRWREDCILGRGLGCVQSLRGGPGGQGSGAGATPEGGDREGRAVGRRGRGQPRGRGRPREGVGRGNTGAGCG